MVKLEELRVFIATAEAGSFVAAAGQLNVAPSVVSKSIRRLEDRLNTTLFNRTTRRIQITGEGEWLLRQAAMTMDNIEAIRARFIDNKAEPQGKLTVDAATPFALHAIAPVISQFTDRYPKIEVSIESSETIADLLARRVDVAIRIGELKDSTLKALRLGNATRALYASPRYLERHGAPRSGSDLARHRCLGFTAPGSLNTWPIAGECGAPLVIDPHLRANSGETLKQLAVYDNGIACLSAFTVQKELERGDLVRILAKQTLPNAIPISAVYYSERAVERHVRLFLDFMKRRADFSPGAG